MRLFYFLFFYPFIALFCTQDLEYRCFHWPYSSTYPFTKLPQVHVIEVNPELYEIKPIKALDNGIGRETVLSIATRSQAIASINGGFFGIGGTFDGAVRGTLKIHDWYALPFKPRGCIGWCLGEKFPKMDRLLVKINIHYDSKVFSVDGLNRSRKLDEMILFTPCFHRTTLTNPDGQEVVVINGVIASIQKGGSTKIPENGFIVSLQENHPLFNTFSVGQPLSFSTKIEPLQGLTSSEEWASLDYIVGGSPLLIYNGNKITNFSAEQTIPTFLCNKHARTAIGILPNGNWLFVVVDALDDFDGMTMDELSELMTDLGCIYALNLDGGGSSTIVYNGIIKNSPRGDEDEALGQQTVRRVSDAIVILPKQLQVENKN